MTGLLQRLAARATGTARTVRSDARLPFGAGPPFEADAAHTLAAPPPGAAARRAAAQPHTVARATDAASAAMSDPPSAALPARLEPPPMLAQRVPQPASTPAAPASPVLQQLPTSHATGLHPQAMATPDAPALPGSGDGARALRPLAVQAPLLQDAPIPLMPRARADTGQPGTAAPALAGPGRRPGLAMPTPTPDTEVHIHIGRIDVTAVHEPARPRPRARERTQPVSLDAYLASRKTT